MKKIFVLAIMLMAGSMAFGQMSAGFKLGINSAGTNGAAGDSSLVGGDYNNILGLQGGAVLEFGFTDNLSLVTEFLYLQRGFGQKLDTEILGIKISVDNSMVLNTIEVPFLLRYTGGEGFKYYGNVGPYVNFLLGGTNTVDFNGNKSEGKIIFEKEPENYNGEDLYVDDTMNRLDFGVYFGGGVGMEVGNGLVFLDLRYGIGFNDLNSLDDAAKPSSYKKFTNKNIGVSVGYMINF